MYKQKMPGSESISSSYGKIMGESGLDAGMEIEDAQRKSFMDFMQKAKSGQVQGQGRFSGKYEPTAIGFQKYLSDNAAYQLDQGAGGKAYYDKISKIDWSKI
jgi:hypothetical protein